MWSFSMNTFYMQEGTMERVVLRECPPQRCFSENKVATHQNEGSSQENPARWFTSLAGWLIQASWRPRHSSIFLEIPALLRHNKLITVIA